MHALFDDEARGASFSPGRRYRYALWRRWQPGQALNVIMLNPSTADEAANDPTVERMERRARAWGYPALVVTNLFAFRATDPRALRKVADPVGPENDLSIRSQAWASGLILCAWGVDGRLHGRDRQVREMLRGFDLYALRIGVNGAPWHPLYLPYSLQPVRWRP